jgi:hypothetical protein
MDTLLKRIRKDFLRSDENFAFVFVKRILEVNKLVFNEDEFRDFLLSMLYDVRMEYIDMLFRASQHGGVVPKVKLVKLLVGDLSEKRKDVLLTAWKKLTRGRMSINLDELKSSYRPENSMLVKAKKRSVEVEKRDFEMYFAFPFIECTNGVVSEEDFINYNTVYSSCFDDDNFFSYQIVCIIF